MFKFTKRFFSEGPFKFMRKYEKPFEDFYTKLTLNYPFKSSTPLTKTLINTSIGIYLLWQFLPYKYMFRHFQISEYTVSRGYLHTIITGSLSHQDFGHLGPNILSYFLFGRLIESKFGTRKMFYLILLASIAGTVAVAVNEKLLGDNVKLIVPKCNGSVPSAALAAATLVSSPMVYLNPFMMKRTFRNELFMMPMFVPAVLFFMLEYYEWKIGYVEYLSRESHIVGGIVGVLFSLKYLR